MIPKLKDNDGFTLVELLVSLTLLSLMAIYAIQALGTLRNMNRVQVELASQMEVDAVARHIRSELEKVSPLYLPDGSSAPKLLFSGKSNSLTYVIASNGEREVGGLYLVNLSLDADGALKSRRQLVQARVLDHVNEVILMRGVQSIQFNYFDTGGSQQAMPEWHDENQLPLAVDVSVSFAEGDKRLWPKMLAKLQNAQ